MQELSGSDTASQNSDPIFQELVRFIADFTGYQKEINLDTSINCDIKIDGDDASDFIQHIERKYSVDFTGFQFKRYFSEEGFRLFDIAILYNWISGKREYEILYVSDLLSAIKRGKWLPA
jgi:Protein of unknown function (DUF1493)